MISATKKMKTPTPWVKCDQRYKEGKRATETQKVKSASHTALPVKACPHTDHLTGPTLQTEVENYLDCDLNLKQKQSAVKLALVAVFFLHSKDCDLNLKQKRSIVKLALEAVFLVHSKDCDLNLKQKQSTVWTDSLLHPLQRLTLDGRHSSTIRTYWCCAVQL